MDPLSPTIFNMVVDVVIRHWESLVAEQVGVVSSNDNSDKLQPNGRKIREMDEGQQWAEE